MKLLLIMRKFAFCLTIFFTIFSLFSFRLMDPFENQDQNPIAGYYIVVAAYLAEQHGYASRYADKIVSEGETAKYGYFQVKNMLFVYLDCFDERNIAIKEMLKTRSEGKFIDAWVYVYKPQGSPEPLALVQIISSDPEHINAESQKDPDVTASKDVEITEDVKVEEVSNELIPVETVIQNELESKEENSYKGMYPMYLWLHHGRITDLVNGEVQVIDPVSGKNVYTVTGNQWEYISKPNNTNSLIQFEADIFGYRKIIHTFDLDKPINDTTDYYLEINSDSITIEFELVRYEKGDIFTMYHVYFYSHSAIMRPESRNELDQLLAMLNESEKYRIRVHGHTNGNASVQDGLYQPETSTNFFTRTGASEESLSAKRLSELRAEAVRNYLVYEGIDKDRMELRGWGGKRALYKKLDPQAIQNVRVEIEILED